MKFVGLCRVHLLALGLVEQFADLAVGAQHVCIEGAETAQCIQRFGNLGLDRLLAIFEVVVGDQVEQSSADGQ